MVGLNASIFHTEGLEVLRKQYDKFLYQKVLTEDVIKMADFVLKNNFLCSIPHFYYIDYIETEFALREKTLCKVPCKGP